MPWFALDDGFDTHPKVRKAGNAAVGLFVRLGVHATKHLTEGHLDGAIVRSYGTAPNVRKLVAVGMLHEPGHICPRCPQPATDGYVIHDYLDYNKSRAQIEASREAARKRQHRGRESARSNRNARDSGRVSSANRSRNEADSAPNRSRNDPPFWDEPAGHDDMSRRDTHEGATVVPSPPLPSLNTGADVRERSTGSSPQGNSALSHITADWQPTTDDRTAAAADVRRLGTAGVESATAKFVRHHLAKGSTAATFGPLWVSWLARERADPPQQGAFLVGLPGGQPASPTPTPPSYRQRMAELDARAAADRAADQHGDTA